MLWCGLGKSARLARVRGSPVRYVIERVDIILLIDLLELKRVVALIAVNN